MTISRTIQEEMKGSSWVRKMFETGQALKQQFGENNVFDFSLGSPQLEPPREFIDALRELATKPRPGMHKYMANAGFLSTRQAVARSLTRREDVTVSGEDVLMTVGAAGAMNVFLASILDPGDEVIVLAPFFVEYLFYVRNHAGVARVVETDFEFDLDLRTIDAAVGPRTRALIINTPNNPTGRIYRQAQIMALARLLAVHEQALGRSIYLIVDTPYDKITYNGRRNPQLFPHHPSTILAHSYSKDLGLAGERIGYLAISPRAPHHDDLVRACTFTNRTLGYVNAPALMQLAVERALDASVDVEQYRRLRDRLCQGLAQAGYEVVPPEGTFFLFLKTPIPNDVGFTEELQKENVLVVPGIGFGRGGHVRIAFCTPMDTIEGALPRFAKVLQRVTPR